MSCDAGTPSYTPAFWDSVCPLWPWESLPQVLFQNFTLLFCKEITLWWTAFGMQQQKHTFLRMSCIPLWAILTGCFTGMKTLHCSLPYQKPPPDSHVPQAAGSLCTDPSVPISMLFQAHSWWSWALIANHTQSSHHPRQVTCLLTH